MVLKIVVDLEDLVFWCIEENLVYFWEENRHSKGWEAVWNNQLNEMNLDNFS